MTLAAGRRLGPYEIVGPLGTGGMGEVYEARDTRLGRTVAIKVLPEGLARNGERLARFEREARTVSQLAHPHVCVLHDVGEAEGLHFLVLEHCEGETLAARLERGPLPLSEALRFGAQIAEALDAAHRQGVIHRDLKPANVMLTRSGVKLLDFGLARLAGGGDAAAAELPTRTFGAARPLTEQGTVLGTYPYMAPEQVEGRAADARSDIFALGSVLYEMAAGRRAFQGTSAASVMAAVLREEPEPLSKLQPVAPPALDHVVSRCLAKEPEVRWQSAKDVAVELLWVADAGSGAAVEALVARRRRSRERLAWPTAAALGALLLAAGAWMIVVRHERTPPPLLRFVLPPPEGTSHASTPAVSPDGRLLAFVASSDDGSDRLWLRPLDSLSAQPLPRTEGASRPFWSPDGRSIGFFAERELRRIDLGSESVRSLTPVAIPWGGSWGPAGQIVFVDQRQGVLRVPASGGPSVRVELFPGEEAGRIFFWPHLLADGERFLFTSWYQGKGGLYLGSLAGREPRLLRSAERVGEGIGRAELDPAGHVVYSVSDREGDVLLAQRFDAGREELLGEPFQVSEAVFVTGPGEARFSVGPSGLLVLRERGGEVLEELVWVGPRGEPEGVLGDADEYGRFDLSPDGSMVATAIAGKGVWLVDTRRGTSTRLVESGTAPVWSPDGRRLAFSAGAPPNPFVIDVAAGGGPRQVASFPQIAMPTAWTPDGERLLVQAPGGLFAVVVESGDAELVVESDEAPRAPEGAVSPDGRWLASVSRETGEAEVYVTGFPRPGRRSRVSTDGGVGPRWSPDGRALFFQSGTRILRVPVERADDGFAAGDPREVFAHDALGTWDLAPEGRLLVQLATGERLRPPLVVVTDWRAAAGIGEGASESPPR